jgi:hypothetical protein
MPFWSNAMVLRLAPGKSFGRGKSLTSLLLASTRAIAFCPPSVSQALPSGPMMTPWGAAPGPSGIFSS